MVQYQRECEQRAKFEMEERFQRWKETELTRIRAEEHSTFQHEIEAMRESYDRELQLRRQQTVALEEELNSKLQRKLKDLENTTYQERQKLLQEYEAFRQKEENMKKEQQLHQKALQLEHERVQRKLDEAHRQVQEAERTKDQLAIQLRDQMARYQMGIPHASFLKSLALLAILF